MVLSQDVSSWKEVFLQKREKTFCLHFTFPLWKLSHYFGVLFCLDLDSSTHHIKMAKLVVDDSTQNCDFEIEGSYLLLMYHFE